jgi:hypothetical protein
MVMARRRTFGERVGAIPAPALTREAIPYELRIAVWNCCAPWLFYFGNAAGNAYRSRLRQLFMLLGWPVDEVSDNTYTMTRRVKDWLLADELAWYDFYKFVETLPPVAAQNGDSQAVVKALNESLEQEGSPFRFVGGELAPITEEQELAEVRAAIAAAGRFALAREHIAQAVSHLSARPEPAYRDCIKETFSAVESVLYVIAGEKMKFPAAIKAFEQRHGEIHGALSTMLEKLHGYASDEEGVRHGAASVRVVGEAEARLMLVTCSAVMNFLIRKSEGI